MDAFVIDLGDLSWSYDNNRKYFSCPEITNLRNSTGVGVMPSWILCGKYLGIMATLIYNRATDYDNHIAVFQGSNYGWFGISNQAYNNASTFKTAMSGVKVFCQAVQPLTFTSLFLSASSTADELTAMPADASPLSELQFADNNWSIEEAVYDAPEADANGVITPTAVTGQMRIQYSRDFAEQCDTQQKQILALQEDYAALEARVSALENA